MSLITETDKHTYGNIIQSTNAHRMWYKPSGAIRTTSSMKYYNIIANLIDSKKTGTALPHHMIASIKPNKMDYLSKSVVRTSGSRRPPGEGFKVTSDGHYDMDHRRLCNLADSYAWAVPTKTKNAKDVTNAMKSVLKQRRKPQKLHVDRGKEFYNNEFKKLMKDNGITMYSTFSNLKASICERFNRTLKEKMWKQFSLQGTYKWIPIVKTLVQSYNTRKHRTIHMKPIDVSADHEKYLLRDVSGKFYVNRTKKVEFKVGDRVRISKYKNVFEKGYTPNWTTEIFTIDEAVNTDPVTYKLIDYEGKPIEGGFYQEELTKVKYPDVYLVEKILRRRGNQIFVKWLGFDHSHNSWINKNDL
ncbi:uncharacterized protein LOC107045636 [Diachasma alloeum]|uniref:uncharacterized protein LOC107045636 n=1 Tax=Diachasma alloeum TaxID=454923 RepID=UPI00073850E2|nr:uncharacterized protein LOC107045636 [Diachasma alloeum]